MAWRIWWAFMFTILFALLIYQVSNIGLVPNTYVYRGTLRGTIQEITANSTMIEQYNIQPIPGDSTIQEIGINYTSPTKATLTYNFLYSQPITGLKPGHLRNHQKNLNLAYVVPLTLFIWGIVAAGSLAVWHDW